VAGAPARSRLRTPLLAVALFVLAVNLRMGISSVGPVLPQVVHDLGTPLVFGSLLTTAPVIMMGLASPFSARLAARFGMEWVVVGAVAVVFVATAARFWITTPLALLLSAIVLGSGIAAGNTMLPAVVRRYFPGSLALMTGIYAVGINAGAGLAAFATPRLAQSLSSSWRGALSVWACCAAVAIVLWLVIALRTPARSAVAPPAVRRSRQAWVAALFFGLQSIVYYGILTWLAPLYEERGWPKTQAGLLLSFFTGMQVVGALTAGVTVQRTGRLVDGLRLTALLSGIGTALIAFTPLSAPWLWAVVLGVGVGGIFPLSLTIPLMMTSSAADARNLTASMLCYGYLLGATGPLIVGVLRSSTGGFEVAFVALAVVCVATFILARPLLRPHGAWSAVQVEESSSTSSRA
jgi:CP family cyanate transporter-like MFS transporter